jgi:hypothetical protein
MPLTAKQHAALLADLSRLFGAAASARTAAWLAVQRGDWRGAQGAAVEAAVTYQEIAQLAVTAAPITTATAATTTTTTTTGRKTDEPTRHQDRQPR